MRIGAGIDDGERRGASPAWRAGRRRSYPGWAMVEALAWTEVTSWGVLSYAFAVLVAPMGAELAWSRGAVRGPFSLGPLASGLAAPLVGRWLDRRGPRSVTTLGSVAALFLLAGAAVDDSAIFSLIWVGLGVASAAVFYEPAFAMVASWFVRYRGRVLTVLTTAGGLASVAYLPLAARLVGAAIFSLQAVALVALVAAPTTAGLVASIAFFGGGFGAITPARAARVAELCGATAYGAIGGVVALFVTLARAAGPVAAGMLRDLWGGYEPVLWLLAAVAAAPAAAARRIDGGRPDRPATEG